MFAVPERMKHERTVQRRQFPCGVTKRTTPINYIYANVLKLSPSLYGCIERKDTEPSLSKARLQRKLHIHTAAASPLPAQDHTILVAPKGTADTKGSLQDLGEEWWPSLN